MSELMCEPQNDTDDTVQDSQALGAWVLPIAPHLAIAVGRYELKYIEYIRECVTLPGVPAYCEQGFVWRNRFIPVLDIYSLITRRRGPAAEGEQLAAIVAYEDTAGKIAVGAILLRGIPRLMSVKPEQSVAVSQLSGEWQFLAQAAFKVDEPELPAAEPVGKQLVYPVLDLGILFNNTSTNLLTLH